MLKRNRWLRDSAIGVMAILLASCSQRGKTTHDAAALESRIEKLEEQAAHNDNRQRIHDVYLRYMRGFDRNDIELMRTAFWPDVQINYGKQSNTFDEFVLRHLNLHVETLKSWLHQLTNENVDINGDVAYGESYVIRLASRKLDGKSDIIGGRYVDRLERRHGEWRIAVREYIPQFSTEMDAGFDPAKYPEWSTSACGMGTVDKRDPSYRRPLAPRKNKEDGPACAE